MSPRILCEYLVGSRRAIETVAATRAAWVPAALFALSAGFAREYDGEDLLAAPWHFLRPLGVSFVTATVLFLVVHGSALAWSKAKKVPTPELRPSFLRFLTLFWWTAPLAWLYAVPYERLLAPLSAFEANLWTLGVVAAWRVLLIARVVGVVYGIHFARALCLVLVFADALVFFVGAVVPGPVLDLMGGINHGERDQLPARVKTDMWVLSMFAAPFVLVAWFWSVGTLRPSWPDLAAKAADGARGATRLAVASPPRALWRPCVWVGATRGEFRRPPRSAEDIRRPRQETPRSVRRTSALVHGSRARQSRRPHKADLGGAPGPRRRTPGMTKPSSEGKRGGPADGPGNENQSISRVRSSDFCSCSDSLSRILRLSPIRVSGWARKQGSEHQQSTLERFLLML